MQTFLPYADFEKTARCLDYRRLGKQRVEAYQLLLIMNDPSKKGWRNHPAFKMWDGYDLALWEYGMVISSEWKRRGYKDTMIEKLTNLYHSLTYNNVSYPSWLGSERFHSSHRSALLFKQYDWYKQFEWSEEPKLDYIWNLL